MLDVLSQSEIDALIGSMNTGEVPELATEPKNSVYDYDFRTANKFTKDQIRTIEAVFKDFAHMFSNYLVGMMHTSCEIEVLSMEEMSFGEFNNSVPAPAVLSIVEMPPLEGSIIFEISTETVCTIVSRVLGGTKSVSTDKKQFTEIELGIMERVVWQSLKYYDDAWSRMFPINSSLERIETSMQFAQVADANEAVLVATLNISIGGETGLASFCLPRRTMAAALKKLNPKEWYTVGAAKVSEADPDKVVHKLSNTSIEIRADFNSTEAWVEDIVKMQPGDVIKLNHAINEPLTALVQGIPKYRVAFGKSRGMYAVKIRSIIKGDEQDG